MNRNILKIHDDAPGMSPRVIIVLGLVLLMMLHAPQDHDRGVGEQATAATAESCNWDREYHGTLAELGEDPTNWTVTPLARGRGGQAWMDQGRAEISPVNGCTGVSSIVKHEWVHLQQARVYGGQLAAVAFYGSYDQLEIAADCGALLLGAVYTPYLGESARCPAGLTRNAAFLVAYGR